MAGHERRASSDAVWQHLPALDGLRAAAVVAVLLFHAGHLQGGFLGVDLFFALSGFLITSLLLRDAEHGGIRLLDFWGRRFRRLLPAVFVLIVGVALWAWTLGSPAELDGVRRTGGWALGYMANWHFIGEAEGYWASFDRPSMFDHLWSLAIEEQFYVVWPLVVLAVWRLTQRASPGRRVARMHQVLLTISIAGVVASLVTMLALHSPGSDPTRVYMGTDTRAASILVGAAMATAPARRVVTRTVGALGRRTDPLVGLVAIGIAVSWLVIDGASSAALYRGGLLLHSAAAAVLVAALVAAPGGRVTSALSARPLVWIGVRSYGLYLWHWPVYVIVSSGRTGLEGPALTVVRIAVSAALAAVSFRLVENPIRHQVTWVRDRRGVPALAGAVALVAATLIVLPTPRQEIAAFDPSTIETPGVAAPTAATPPAPQLGPPAPDRAWEPATSVSTIPTITTTAPTPMTAGEMAATAVGGEAQPARVATNADRSSRESNRAPETSATSATSATAVTSVVPTSAPDPPAADRPTITRVMWTGDSVAYDLAPGVSAALSSAGIDAQSSAYLGMRLSGDGQFALLPRLRTALHDASIDVVVVQLSLWDADHDPPEQRAALDELHALVVGEGARLVVVSPPPTVDTARDAMLAAMTDHARAMAAAEPASTLFLDSSAVWGGAFDADLDDDGTPERKRDGVHVCPAGAARFASWLTAELAGRFEGVAPAPPSDWALGDWVTDGRYDEPVGSCAPLE